MSLPQRKFREVVFQYLYSYDFDSAGDRGYRNSLLMGETHITKKNMADVEKRVMGILPHIEEIDNKIMSVVKSYSFDRIPRVERSVLRLGVFELCYDDDIPAKVAIAEALRLARKFSTPEAASFINAILDSFYKLIQGEIVDDELVLETAAEFVDSEEVVQRVTQDILENHEDQ